MLFYELTWSIITAKQKEVLAYDNSGEYSFRRAEVNNLMKKFSNDTGPDPIIYLGESRDDILVSFGQSFCWMTKSSWDDLPDDVTQACSFNDDSAAANIHVDQYAFISHSHGRFEGGDIAQAVCTDGFLVSKLPAKFSKISKVLKPTDYVLTKCAEGN